MAVVRQAMDDGILSLSRQTSSDIKPCCRETYRKPNPEAPSVVEPFQSRANAYQPRRHPDRSERVVFRNRFSAWFLNATFHLALARSYSGWNFVHA
jgi:hypothetical protein